MKSRLLHPWSLPIFLASLLFACFHRYAGFKHPHQVWFREAEKAIFGKWFPAAFEHLVGGVAFLLLLSYFSARLSGIGHPKPVTRIVLIFSLVYLVFSVFTQDVAALMAGDSAQTGQIAFDLAALAFSYFYARSAVADSK